MIAALRSIWIWSAGFALIAVWVPVLGLVRAFDRDPLRLRTGRCFRLLGRMLSRLSPWRIHLLGAANLQAGRPYVIVSNHQSLGDIPLITHLRVDAKWLAKAELFRLPLVGWLMTMAGDIPVDRANRRKAAQALLKCGRYLRQGCSVVFFPEGTRSRDGEMLPFNEGPFQLAIRERVPVLPLVVEGTLGVLKRRSWLFGGARDIYLKVLEPVAVDGWGVKQSAELMESVRARMVEELSRLRGLVAETEPAP